MLLNIMILRIFTLGIMTLNIMPLSIMTLCIIPLSIMTLSIMPLSIMKYRITLSIGALLRCSSEHYNKVFGYYARCRNVECSGTRGVYFKTFYGSNYCHIVIS